MIQNNLRFIILLSIIISTCNMPASGKYMGLKRHYKKAKHLLKYRKPYVLQNVPVRDSWNTFLDQLNSTISFFNRNTKSIDMNVNFALFLVSVHLQSIMKDMSRKLIDAKLMERIQKIERSNFRLILSFGRMVNKIKEGNVKDQKLIQTMLTDVGLWRDHMMFFPAMLSRIIKTHHKAELDKQFGSWKNYSSAFVDGGDWRPSPEDLAKCLVAMAKFPVKETNYFAHMKKRMCNFNNSNDACRGFIENGSPYGYALNNRIMLVTFARYARQCKILEDVRDQQSLNKMCTNAFTEAEYIAANEMHGIDLMLEHIVLCSTNGYYGFHMFQNQNWLKRLLTFREPEGCFRQGADNMDMSKVMFGWKMTKQYIEQGTNNGKCNAHVTGLAAAAFASVARTLILAYHQ